MESANAAGCDFPIQNLPLGVFRTKGDAKPRAGIAIGEFILDAREWIDEQNLNAYMQFPAVQRRDLRREFSRALRRGARQRELIAQRDAEMLLPAVIGDYTDFYASIHHATNVGRLFRPDNPLLPNFKHVPIAYHGRASSIVISGTAVRRPSGQLGLNSFGPTQQLDYEVELAAFLGPGNPMGEPIPIADAEEHLAGVCLLNDWSARDIQRWEYQPLGPFLGKNFATSISPWIITLEALEPFRVPAPEHDIEPLPYLKQPSPAAFEITLEVWLRRAGTHAPVRMSHTSFQEMYWTFGQMVAHHTANGCPLRAGDLLGSGTVSGPEPESRGCLLEAGLPFLNDGDEVTLTGYCERPGLARIGLGDCKGTISGVAYNQKK